jgi:hypothetical protein
MDGLTLDFERSNACGRNNQEVLLDLLLDTLDKGRFSSACFTCDEQAGIGVLYKLESLLLILIEGILDVVVLYHCYLVLVSRAKVEPCYEVILHNKTLCCFDVKSFI